MVGGSKNGQQKDVLLREIVHVKPPPTQIMCIVSL